MKQITTVLLALTAMVMVVDATPISSSLETPTLLAPRAFASGGALGAPRCYWECPPSETFNGNERPLADGWKGADNQYLCIYDAGGYNDYTCAYDIDTGLGRPYDGGCGTPQALGPVCGTSKKPPNRFYF